MQFIFANTGFDQFDFALTQLSSRANIRKVVVPAARAGLRPVRDDIKRRAVRTHPLSMNRPYRAPSRRRSRPTAGPPKPLGRSRFGPMSRYVGVRALKAGARKPIGARTVYNTTIFPRFVVHGKKSGKRFFYPALQEYGTANAKPPIPSKYQTRDAANSQSAAALNAFAAEFRNVYPRVVEQIRSRGGATSAF